MNEAEFLDLFALTKPELTPQVFYDQTQKINQRIEKETDLKITAAFKRGVEGGKDIQLKAMEYGAELQRKILKKYL